MPHELSLLARDLAAFPSLVADAPLIVAAVEANSACVADAARRLMRMEDHPGGFDAWCRGFVGTQEP